MALLVNTYNTLHLISPYYINVERSAADSNIIIITDVVNNNEPGEMYTENKGTSIWLKVASDGLLEVLTSTPDYGDELISAVPYLDKMRLRIKNGEAFLIEYNNTAKNDATQRTVVKGVQMGSEDIIYVHIDTKEDLITIYEP